MNDIHPEDQPTSVLKWP